MLEIMLNIKLHHINYSFKIALPLLPHTNLVDVNINIGILLFLNVAPSQNLVFAPSVSIQIRHFIFSKLMTKPERGSLDWYRVLCQMHWSKGLLNILSDDTICILSGQSQVKVPGWMVLIQNS